MYNIGMLKSKITIYRLPWKLGGFLADRENWYISREEYFAFNTILEGEEAAEYAFTITTSAYENKTNEKTNVAFTKLFLI